MGKPREHRSTISENTQRKKQITTLSVQSVSTTQGSWRLLSHNYDASHSHTLLFSITLKLYTIVIFCIYCSTHTYIMFALGVFILIHSIWLFTNIALNGTLTLFADIALSLFSTDSTIVWIDLDLIIWPWPNQTIGLIFWPWLSGCQPIWSLLGLFLVFDCWLFLNRIGLWKGVS